MHLNYLVSCFVIAATCIAFSRTGPLTPTTDPQYEGIEVDLFKKSCTLPEDCSCIGGIPICYNGNCNCIYPYLACIEHKPCNDLCGSEVGICLDNVCKCYNLVENTMTSHGISPLVHEEVS